MLTPETVYLGLAIVAAVTGWVLRPWRIGRLVLAVTIGLSTLPSSCVVYEAGHRDLTQPSPVPPPVLQEGTPR